MRSLPETRLGPTPRWPNNRHQVAFRYVTHDGPRSRGGELNAVLGTEQSVPSRHRADSALGNDDPSASDRPRGDYALPWSHEASHRTGKSKAYGCVRFDRYRPAAESPISALGSGPLST